MKLKDINKLKIGEIYYIPNGTWGYKKVTLIEILDSKGVLVSDKKNKKFRVSISKLQKTPDKAVSGFKARQRVKHQMNEMEQKRKESLVDKEVQKKVKKLGHSTYATVQSEKYVVNGYKGSQPRFDTLEELDKWADDELIKLEDRREEIRSKGYKYLKIEGKDGTVAYYQNLNFIFTKFKIRCKSFKGDISEIPENELLNKDDVPEMKIEIAR